MRTPKREPRKAMNMLVPNIVISCITPESGVDQVQKFCSTMRRDLKPGGEGLGSFLWEWLYWKQFVPENRHRTRKWYRIYHPRTYLFISTGLVLRFRHKSIRACPPEQTNITLVKVLHQSGSVLGGKIIIKLLHDVWFIVHTYAKYLVFSSNVCRERQMTRKYLIHLDMLTTVYKVVAAIYLVYGEFFFPIFSF